MAKRGQLIIFSGPSGVGKGTVRKEVFKHPELNLKYSVSMTTRAPREKEVEGVDYFFVSEERFKQAIANNELLEYAKFVGHYYGTPKAYVETLLQEGYNVMLEIEVDGANQIMKNVKDYIAIFLVPPSLQELECRIRHRHTEKEEVLQERLNKAKQEIGLTRHYEYVVLNDDVKRAEQEVVQIIKRCQQK